MKRVLITGLIGCIAGLIATLPMTAVLVFLRQRLPLTERFSFPPFKVAMKASKHLGLNWRMGPRERLRVTLAAHFGFGAAAGGFYGLLVHKLPLPAALRGTLYGLVVWASSYFGWLPISGLYRAPTEESPRRQALMAVAHLVWGPILGVLFEQWSGQKDERAASHL